MSDWLSELKVDSVLSLPVRFDRGAIRNAEITPEGYLRADAIYCRDGILEYRTPSGRIQRELRLPEANQKALTGFGLKPYTTEHPPVLLDAQNAKQYAQGMTDSTVYYDPKAGFVRGVVAVFDSDAIASIMDGRTVEISAGYQCAVRNEPGTWRGERYDAVQEELRPNHVAGTVKGRAGSEVRFLNLFDSYASRYDSVAYEDPGATDAKYFDFGKKRADTKKTMATITRNGLTFEDVPGDLANFIMQEFNRMDSELEDLSNYNAQLEEAARTDADSIGTLNAQVTEHSEEATRQMGRADELEMYLTNADSILGDMGFRRDSDGDYFRTDGRKKKAFVELDDEDLKDPMDLDEDPDDDEEIETTIVKKKKQKKQDSAKKSKKIIAADDDEADEDPEEEAEETPEEEAAEESEEEPDEKMKIVAVKTKKKQMKKGDSIGDRLNAWKAVEKIVPGIMDSDHFDSELDTDGIKALEVEAMKNAIKEVQPDRDLENRSDSYIEGVYEGLGLRDRAASSVSRVDHSSNLDVIMNATARHGGTSPLQTARQEVSNQLAEAWKTPLAMSTRNKQ